MTSSAWRNRGGPDPRPNLDFEDLIYMIDNRLHGIVEVQADDAPVRAYLREQFAAIQHHPHQAEIVGCHLSERARLPFVLARIETLAAME